LIPPDVAEGNVSKRTFTTDVIPGYLPCNDSAGAIDISVRGKRATVTVSRDLLAKQERGALEQWAVQLEEQRCLAPGEGMKIAERVTESVPLNASTAIYLLHSNELRTGDVDLGRYARLRVVSPIWFQPGVRLMAEGPYTVTGHDYSLSVTGKSTDNLAGYETTIYSIAPKTKNIGYAITPLYTDRHINGKSERASGPTANYLSFSPEAAFYRLFYKSSDNDFTELLVAGRTPEELSRNIGTLRAHAASASCNIVERRMCIPIRKDIAVTSLIAVTVNGSEVLTRMGATVADALAIAKVPKPNDVLSTLRVYKVWKSRPVPVVFQDDSILRLALAGGEVITFASNQSTATS
jgi:hypothetical protein